MPDSTASRLAAVHADARQLAFKRARHLLAKSPSAQSATKPHRAIGHVALHPSLLIEMVAMPVLLMAALVLARDWVDSFWRTYILWWAAWLNLPLTVSSADASGAPEVLIWQATTAGFSVSNGIWFGTGLTAVAWTATFFMRGHWLPIKYLIRMVCAVQALSLLYFLFMPGPFPYSVLNHVVNMLDTGYTLMMVMPVLMALGYYALRLRFGVKLLHTSLIWAFFLLMVPQKAMVHLVLLQHFSVVFMPVLYLFFGALFDMMIFVSLYAWAASKAPTSATT